MARESYSDYFLHRGVSSDFYKDYQIPAYILEILPPSLETSVLDIGCGFGQLLNALRNKGYKNLEGVDLSPEAVKSCQDAGLSVKKIESLEQYAEQVPRKFDLIVMSHVLEHIDKSKIIAALATIKGLLSSKGQLLLMVPNAQSNTGCYWAYEDFTHDTLFTAGSVSYCLKSAGFEKIVFLDPQGTAGLNWPKKIIKSFLLRLYTFNYDFWNKVTTSSFHKPSARIFSFELKVLAG